MDEKLLQDYEALTTGGGYAPLDGWSTLRVTGGDRIAFLNNLCTNDVKSLTPGHGCEAFFCDVKGKIVAHAFLLVREDDVLVVGVPATSAKLLPHLDRYIIREDVQLFDETESRHWGVVAEADFGELFSLAGSSEAPDKAAVLAHRVIGIEGGALTLVVNPIAAGDAILVAANGDSLQRILAASGLTSCETAAWQALRIESAFPLWGVDFDDSNLPQEVGRDAAAISFRKGCYLGQETVARIDALGHVNKQLSLVKFAARGDAVPPAVTPGAAVLGDGGGPAGALTAVAWSPRLGASLAFAMLRRGFNGVGAKVRCGGVEGEVIAPLDAR